MHAAAQSLAAKSSEKTGPKFLWPNKSEVRDGSTENSPPWHALSKASLRQNYTRTYRAHGRVTAKDLALGSVSPSRWHLKLTTARNLEGKPYCGS